ncbi:Asr1405/Asl0597 family protein [Fortiea contorta]|uniref:Asr1405/Asl0597 family protein n=1 Tax=Fortiea contorta TaxID=1892405 RepID=UPI0004776A72|nr:Asr1405/Asl0597 family protein [Fortiea contorta]
MKSHTAKIEHNHVVEVDWVDRWRVYHRLQELEIPCWCAANQPLRVEINTPTAAVQLWSVAQQCTASRDDLIWILKQNWQLRYRKS